MNKFKKTAMIVTSIIMAGTMVFSFAACGGGGGESGGEGGGEGGTSGGGDEGGSTGGDDEYTPLEYTSGTTIGIAIGYSSATTGAFYASSGSTGVITDQMTICGNYTATTGGIKPAFSAIQDALNIKFENYYTGLATSANIDSTNSSSIYNSGEWGTTALIATSDLSVAVAESTNNQNILNLADYLDQMPNFKKFLEENPVVYLSLLQDGMQEDGSGEAIYVAPYFDGNDDIERYCLIRQDWVEELLDDELQYTGDTYAQACASSTSVSGGWMGKTNSYSVETSKEDGSGDTFTLVKDYDDALTAAKNENSALGAAYKEIAGSAYSGDSGNIVDIMNAAISENSDATGKQLATLYRAYIDVCYQTSTGAKAYENRSDLFNGYSAAWDVDDLVAMLRIVKTNSANVGLDSCTTVGIYPRDCNNDRTPDIIRLAAQLYGERGADSRYEYTYIDNDGNLIDARQNESFWECLEAFGELASENLVFSYYENGSYSTASGNFTLNALRGNTSYPGYGFMEYDYSQTQTAQMFSSSADTFGEDYMFGAINTPVSKWDVDGDGDKEETMRFTESWRSTKTGGLVVHANAAKNTNTLNAILTFIDYLYSNDGQILSTYGIQDTTENSSNPNGTWYGNEVTNVDIDTVATMYAGQYVVDAAYESQYFCFGNKLYKGTLYKGKMTPVVTDELLETFSTENDITKLFSGSQTSFTSFARMVLGATLPMGVKDQSFENQLTATAAAEAATRVSVSLANGTIKHVTLEVDSSNYWYTTVPTGLPLESAYNTELTATSQAKIRGLSGTNMNVVGKNFYSLFHHIIWEGYTGSYSQQGYTVDFGSISNASELISYLNSECALSRRATMNASGWTTAKTYWTYLSK